MSELAELQAMTAAIRAERGFTTDPVKLLALLIEEVGEVAGELKKIWSANYDDMIVDDLADELADAFVLLSAIATEFDIDLEHAVERKFVTADGQRSWTTAVQHKEES